MSLPMDDLLSNIDGARYRPLADLLRPQDLDGYIGQEHILGPDKPLRRALEAGSLHSMILWGPPGVGKTTLARVISSVTDSEFFTISAVMSGVKEIRATVEQAKQIKQQSGRQSVLFVDEVHRFNKAQQDGFLPHIEDGTLLFIGATTENPSFELNNALLSRAKVYVLKPLERKALRLILEIAVERLDGLQLKEGQIDRIVAASDGDARRLLNVLEMAKDLVDHANAIQDSDLNQLLSDGSRFDKGGDIFYDQISALHKSVRGSDPDATLYWFERMIQGGCDPRYVARRIQRMASEDIGNADPRAMEICLNAWQTYERLGSPEGELALAQAVVYLACAPKSNAVYAAFSAAMADAKSDPSYEVPTHLRNAPTALMKELGHGEGYRYAHSEQDHYAAGETYFPDEIAERQYYFPVDQGLESKIRQKLEYLKSLDAQPQAAGVNETKESPSIQCTNTKQTVAR